ncbi:MAG: hypothetical protein J6B95_07710 [Oscillospiraceae bacterium]|nr:hypothetical protein [Oscillospiraceae bacterium]
MEDVTVFGESYSEAAEEWLAGIDVEDEWHPDYEDCLYWYRSQEDNSQLLRSQHFRRRREISFAMAGSSFPQKKQQPQNVTAD